MSDTNFWTYVIPYIETSIAEDTQLISGNNFDIKNVVLWMQYKTGYVDNVGEAVEGIPATFQTRIIDSDNEYCSSDKVFGNTNLEGSFPFKVVGHNTAENWNFTTSQFNKYMCVASLGNIEMPFFKGIVEITETVGGIQELSLEPSATPSQILDDPGVVDDFEPPEVDAPEDPNGGGVTPAERESFQVPGERVKQIGNIFFSYSYAMETFYRGEETLIKENWQQYTSEKSEYSGFNDAYDGYVNDLISNSYVESNSDQKFFVFQKTTKPINLSYMSALPDPVIDDVVSTAATTTTSDTVITTSGGPPVVGEVVVNTDTGGLTSGGPGGYA
jgi:hypothetical protein